MPISTWKFLIIFVRLMEEKISKIYTTALVLLPALNVYRSFIPSVEFGTFLIAFCSLVIFISKPGFNSPQSDAIWIYLLSFFFVCTTVSIVLLDYNLFLLGSVLARFFKVVLIVFTLFMIGRYYFDYEWAIKVLRFFSILCVIFILVQYLCFYGFSVRLMGVYAPFTSAEGYADYDFNRMYRILFRPSAFFFEPAHLSAYLFVYLCYLLSYKEEKKCLLQQFFLVLGILLSTSGTGFVILPLLYFYTFLNNYRKMISGRYLMRVVIILICIAGLIYLFSLSDFGTSAFRRIINNDGTLGTAATGRLQSGAYDMFKQLPLPFKLIGCGFGNRPTTVYFSSLYSLLYGDGYLGTSFFFFLLFVYYMRSNGFGKLLLLTYVFLLIGTGVFNFATIGLYFSMISINRECNDSVNITRI